MRILLALVAVAVVAGCGDDGGDAGLDAGLDDAGVDAALDEDAPTVISVTPATGSIGVPIDSTIVVTFSEAMAAATIDATTITLSPAAPATVIWDEGSLTATVTVTSPLPRAVEHTVEVSAAVTDLAGNPLAAPFASTFTTERATVTRLDDGGAAMTSAPQVAYDAAGNGVAVWLSSEMRYQIDVFYATYTAATSTWSPEVQLANNLGRTALHLATDGDQLVLLVEQSALYRTLEAYVFDHDTSWVVGAKVTLSGYGSEAQLVPHASGFLAAYHDGALGVAAAFFDGTSWGPPTVLGTGIGIDADTVRAATDGDAFAVTWLQTIGSVDTVHLAIHEAAAWQSATTIIEATVTDDATDLVLAGAANQTGFVAVWEQRPPAATRDVIYAVRYLRAGATGTLQALEKLTTAPTSSASDPRVAPGPLGDYAVVWSEASHLRLSEWSGSTWGAAEQITSTTESRSWYDVYRTGPRYGVLWLEETGDGHDLFGRIRNAGVWEAQEQLDGANVDVTEVAASGGAGFGAVFREVPAAGGAAEMVRKLYPANAWGARIVISTATSGVSAPFLGVRGTSFVSAWSQDADLAIRAGGGTEIVTTLDHPGHASSPQLVASGGRSMTVWSQGVGQGDARMASVYDPATGWSSAEQIYPVHDQGTDLGALTRAGTFLALEDLSVRYHDGTAWDASATMIDPEGRLEGAAASADAYMIVYSKQNDDSDENELYFTTTSDGTWSTPALAPSSDPDQPDRYELVATAQGFAAVWQSDNVLYAAHHDGLIWSAVTTLGPADTTRLEVASGAAGTVAAWVSYDAGTSTDRIYAAVHDGSTWGTTVAISDDVPGSDGSLVAAAHDGGFAVAWVTSTAAKAAVYTSSWSAPELLDVEVDDNDSISGPMMVSDGEGYLVLWLDYDSVSARRWDGAGWAEQGQIAGPLGTYVGLVAAAGATGYRMASSVTVTDHVELQSCEVGAGGFGPLETLVVAFPGDASMSLGWNGSSFAGGWAHGTAADVTISGIYGLGEL